MLTLEQPPTTSASPRKDPMRTPPDHISFSHLNRAHSASGISTKSAAYVWPTLLFLGTAFGLATGLGYGSGNHWQYLLHGRHLLDPTFLANDWLTSHTPSHHLAFAHLLALVGRFMALDSALAWANAAAAVVYALCIFAIAAKCYRSPVVVTALTVLIIVMGPLSHIGMSNLLMSYFQPSTIGGVGMLAALTCLIHSRYKNAGVLFLIAGLFHLSYMIWAGLIVGAVVVLNWGRTRKAQGPPSTHGAESIGCVSPDGSRFGLRQALYVVVPIGLTAVYHLPYFLTARTPEDAAHAASAHIFHDIYMPGHSRPRTWGLDPFVRFGSFLAAGLVAYAAVRTEHRLGRTALIILGALAAIVGGGLLLTTVVQVDTVALLFPYRLAPFLILAGQTACAAALVTTAQRSRLSLPRTLLLWAILAGLLYGGGLRSAYALACVFSPVIALLGVRIAKERRVPLWIWGIVSLCLLGLLAWGDVGRTGVACVGFLLAIGFAWAIWTSGELRSAAHATRRAVGEATGNRAFAAIPYLGRAALPLLIAVFLMQMGAARKDFLGPPPTADEQNLYQWCQARTARGDVFIIPPSLSGFRLGAERAIVIDFRCIGARPSENVEWYNRLRAEGGADFNSLAEVEAGYRTMDAARAREVAGRYGARYVVIAIERHRGDLHGLRRLYANPTFAVYDLEQDLARSPN